MRYYTNNQSVVSQKQKIVIVDLYAKVGKDKMSFPTSSIFIITLKLFLENCSHIIPKRLHRFVSPFLCGLPSLKALSFQQGHLV